MRVLRTKPFIVCVLGLAGCLAGCVPAKSQAFRNFFIPPSPKAQNTDDLQPPFVESAPDIKDVPRLFVPSDSDARPGGRTDAMLRQAELHYQAGRKYYQDGDEENARKEFDRAIDILLSAPDGATARLALEKRLNEYVEAIHRYDLAGLGAGDFQSDPGFEKPPLEDLPQLTFPIDPKLKNKVLEEVQATASQLPLEVNDTVLSFIKYFSSERGRRIVISGLRRQGRYRPMIQRILAEEGVPQELIFLAQAESGFLPRAMSRMRAGGMWQFLVSRGREYGLTQTPYTDYRFDPEKATRAAARHLRDLYHRYGDWYLAMAAYNCGPGNVDKAVQRTGYADFWELRRRSVLPRETTNYVPIVLAMTIMVKNSREYNLEDYDPDPPVEYETVNMSAPANLMLLADLADVPVSQIRDLNPALLKGVAPAGYALRVPKNAAQQLQASLESVPAERRAAWRAHRVAEGDTLGSVARRFRVTESAIATVNQVDGTLETGDLLVIPTLAERAPAAVKAAAGGKRHVATAARSRRGGALAKAVRATSAKARTSKAPTPKTAAAKPSGKRRALGYSAANVAASPRHRTVKR